MRIGVFVCRCGSNIAGTVDTAAVAERMLPGDVEGKRSRWVTRAYHLKSPTQPDHVLK